MRDAELRELQRMAQASGSLEDRQRLRRESMRSGHANGYFLDPGDVCKASIGSQGFLVRVCTPRLREPPFVRECFDIHGFEEARGRPLVRTFQETALELVDLFDSSRMRPLREPDRAFPLSLQIRSVLLRTWALGASLRETALALRLSCDVWRSESFFRHEVAFQAFHDLVGPVKIGDLVEVQEFGDPRTRFRDGIYQARVEEFLNESRTEFAVAPVDPDPRHRRYMLSSRDKITLIERGQP